MTETEKLRIEALNRTLAVMGPDWMTEPDIRALTGFDRQRQRALLLLMLRSQVDYRVIGMPWSPEMGGLEARGSKIPKRLGFSIWRKIQAVTP